MELVSINIKNYRIHRNLTIHFSNKLNLIGGENETGKSTVAEAIHRVLFFKAKGDSAQHKEMKSLIFTGDPEVELVFIAKGNKCKLYKKFGSRGDVRLTVDSKETLIGDAAETELKDLLFHTETNLTGNNLKSKWSLLWVWQGSSGTNPVNYISETHSQLLNKLQTYGASVLLSSNFDTTVAKLFSDSKAITFNTNGSTKAGSPLKKAEEKLEETKALYNNAQTRINDLQTASENFEKNKREILKLKISKEKTSLERNELEKNIAEIKELQKQQADGIRDYNIIKNDLDVLIKTQKEIFELEENIGAIKTKLEPTTINLIESRNKLNDYERDFNDMAKILVEERNAQSKIYNSNELCRLFIEIQQLKIKLESLKNKKEKADSFQSQINKENVILSDSLLITEIKAKELRVLANKIDQAKAALNAISTSFEVLSAKEDVLINGEKLAINSVANFAEAFEVTLGNHTKIKVTPGGGSSLNTARSNHHNLQTELQKRLKTLGFNSVEEAESCLKDREAINNKINLLTNSLSALNADNIERDIIDVENDISNQENQLSKRAVLYKIDITNFDAENVPHILKANEIELDVLNTKIATIDLSNRKVSETIDSLRKTIQKIEDDIQKDDKQLNSDSGTLQFLINKIGSKVLLSEKISAKQEEEKREKESLNYIKSKLENKNPDEIERNLKRLNQAINNIESDLKTTNDELIKLQVTLTNNGTENPNEILNKSQEKYTLAIDLEKAERRKADAILLLDKLFSEEQKELTNKLTQPLADKIGYYLEPIFGREVSVNIVQENSNFKEFNITRKNNETFSFDTLSGGTKEQFSAAVRLAMAEVLSSDYDNKLPIVFDDAFTNTDQERLSKIQPMLDRASEKGIQVIVLSCNPADYVTLGAQQIAL